MTTLCYTTHLHKSALDDCNLLSHMPQGKLASCIVLHKMCCNSQLYNLLPQLETMYILFAEVQYCSIPVNETLSIKSHVIRMDNAVMSIEG